MSELLEVALAMRDWIDDVPSDTPLPTMRGFDRDWADSVIDSAKFMQGSCLPFALSHLCEFDPDGRCRQCEES